MHKVTSAEAQRVIAVLDDALDRLTHVSRLSKEPDAQFLERLPADGAEGVRKAAEAVWQSEARLRSRRLLPAGNASPTDAGEVRPESESEMEDLVCDHVRALCREVRGAPAARAAFVDAQLWDEAAVDFINNVSQLKGVVYWHLSTTIEEEAANRELLHDLDERAQGSERERDRLQSALNALRSERDREVSALDQTLRKLRAELGDLAASNEQEVDGIEKGMKDEIAASSGEHDAEKKRLEDALAALNRALAEGSDEHRELENTQRRLKARKENDINLVIAQYDEAMLAKQREIEDLRGKMEVEKEEFKDLEEHFNRVDAHAARRTAEEDRLEELRKCEAEAVGMLGGAALLIQSLVRTRQQRAEFFKVSAKKGKKGKGKGKKKRKAK